MNKNPSEISVQFLRGVGPARKKFLEQLGVETVEDLLHLYPHRYEDRRNILKIAQVKVGEFQAISGKVFRQYSRQSFVSRKRMFEAVLDDGSGRITAVWFNQPYLEKQFMVGVRCFCYGKVEVYKNKLQIISPEFEIIDDEKDALSLNRIVPVYPLTAGLTQKMLRRLMLQCLDDYESNVEDPLPVALRNKHHLVNLKHSLRQIHFPENPKVQEEAVRRLSFEEFYFFQIATFLRRMSVKQAKGISHKISDAMMLKFVHAFPFELTAAQKRVIREISQDMAKSSPMLRLLQGDVGSGKTLMAIFGCVAAFENGYQSAIMAPTEILARQHYLNIRMMIEKGFLPKMRVGLLISGLPKKEHDDILVKIKSGELDIVVGTHALITEGVMFKRLSFVVVDEQHKFGVAQRALLPEKGSNPHVLIMTATPIPRTLYISLYGDLDVSVIDEYPKGRGKIVTKRFRSEDEQKVYENVKAQVKAGRQAYIVYPLVDESEKLDLKSAEEMFARLKSKEFKEFRLGMVHGRMKREDVEEVMTKFKKHELDILVATTVLEVGIDVANANVMVIEHAERFGLAQLHQLRGRIGRGVHDSFCYLIADPMTEDGIRRLDAIVSTTDGFKIAEHDLQIRGPGHYFGRFQSGLTELKVANPLTQMELLKLARSEASAVVDQDPKLTQPDHIRIRQTITKKFPGYLDLVHAG